MADAAIEVFLGLARDFYEYNRDLFSGVEVDFNVIREDMETMRAFLLDASNPECRRLEGIKVLISKIRDVTYDAEDVIEQYVMYKYGGKFQRLMDYFDIRNIGGKFKNIRERIQLIKNEKLFNDITTLNGSSNRTSSSQSQGVVAIGNDVVGLVKETSDLLGHLTRVSNERRVVLVAGMPGLGKTTLANKVLTDRNTIGYKFLHVIWVPVSKQYDRGSVLRQIWRVVGDSSLGDPKNIASDVTPAELTRQLQRILKDTYCLIVLDDVWSDTVWNELQSAFPRENQNLSILITSRVSTVAPDAFQFKLDRMGKEKGFELLEKRVFGNEKCPEYLKVEAEEIVAKCDGLPFAIVIIAGVLRRLPLDNTFWEVVSTRVPENVASVDSCWAIVRLSYDNLEPYLRPCFLYFGIFPQSTPIDVSKLFCLWIAEGFIKAQEGQDLEDVAETYLQELVNRNLVLVEETNSSNKIKKCRVHDILHDLCIKEAKEEKIFYQIKDLDHYLTESSQQTHNHRRVSIHESTHSHVLDFLPKAKKSSGVLVRSLLSLGQEVPLPMSDINTFPGPFQLLRVLDVLSILLPRLPDSLSKLVHLRYLAIYISFDQISPDLSKLFKLQVFIVKVKEGENIYRLKVGANIWQMYQLRHIQTNIPLYFSLPKRRILEANKSPVRAMSFVSPETCTLDFFAKINRVKKLGILGDLGKLPNVQEAEEGDFGFLQLEHLEVVKIKNKSSLNGQINFFPGKRTFPSTIRQLTLSNTLLSWETHMNVIAKLPNLVVLKLKNRAFVGKYWKPPAEGFLKLQVFLLGNTDLEDWDASSDHFPVISSICLRFCDQLKSIPLDFAKLKYLQKLDLYSTNPTVVSAARAIQSAKEQQDSGVKLQLSIFPSDH